MRNFLNRLCAALLWLGLIEFSPQARAVSGNPPNFEEIQELVRTHLAGATDSNLDRASLDGLLESLRGRVRLVGGSNDLPAQASAPAIAKVAVLEDRAAYLRVNQVTPPLPEEIRRQCRSLMATNKLIGLVLDLRFASGDDYAAAAAVADLFVTSEKPLLDWGNGMVKSVEKTDALNFPVAVLLNAETTGAAEALAAVLRQAGVALIFGGTTRGAAMTTRDFPLKNGQQLRIAISPVKLGNGEALTAGVKPDIEVAATPEAERAFLDDPYQISSRTNLAAVSTNSLATTNRPTRRTRPNEADLVRARRDGLSLDGDVPVGRDAEPEKPVLRDPALARAVDLLKGLAVVRRTKS